MRRVVFIVVMAMLSLSLSAQESVPYIEVSGRGEVKMTPTMAYIGITVDESDPATRNLDEAERAIAAALKEAGISAESALTVDNLVSSYVKRKQSGQRKNYTLKVEDIKLVGRVFDALQERGISNSRLKSTDISKAERAEAAKNMRAMAVGNAAMKAGQLAEAAGVKVGKPILIQDYTSSPAPMIMMSRSMKNMASDEALDLDFEDIEFSGSVTIRFAIE